MEESCPKCGKELTCDEVDIGVGVMTGNYRCNFCGWNEKESLDSMFNDDCPHDEGYVNGYCKICREHWKGE